VDEVVVISEPAMLGGDDVGYGAAALANDFESYVRRHAQALCRGAFLLTGDRHLAEDLVQTALAKVAGRWDHIVANGTRRPTCAR
jgi:DNA-directed RNA polymerase specialized sigma24 family protein